MSDHHASTVPVWTLSTSDATGIPVMPEGDALTPERLAELRTALPRFRLFRW
jgi:hypothetical protein